MERTTSSGVDGRSRDAMRKKKDISRSPPLGDFPCRLAGRQTAATGRNNAHCRQSMGPRAVATPFSVSCLLAALAFAFNPLTFLSFYSRVVGCVYLAKKFGF